MNWSRHLIRNFFKILEIRNWTWTNMINLFIESRYFRTKIARKRCDFVSKTGCFNSTSSKTYDFRLKMSESVGVRLNHGNFKKSMIWEQKMQNYDFMPETGYFTSKIAFSTRIYAIQNTFFERENVLFWLTLTLNGQKMNQLKCSEVKFQF